MAQAYGRGDAIPDFGAYKWLLVALLWCVGCLNYIDRQAIFSVLPLLRRELAMSDIQLALLGTVFLWVYGASSPFGGYFGDRFRRKSVVLLSLFIFSLVTLASGLARTGGQLVCLRGLLGISEALYLPAALALIADHHSPQTRATAIGVHQTSLLAGGLVGGVFAGYMGDHYGWRNVFSLLGLAGIALALVLAFWLRKAAANASEFQISGSERYPASRGRVITALLSTPTVLCLMLCGAAVSMAGWVVMAWMPLYLYEKFRMSMTASGFNAIFFVSVATIAGMLGGGALGDRWLKRDPRGRMLAQMIGLAIAFPGLLVIGLADSAAMLRSCLVLFGLGRGLWDCNNMPILCEVVPPCARSTAYGIFNFANTVGGGASVLLVGILKQSLGVGLSLSGCSLIVLLALAATGLTAHRFLLCDMGRMRTKTGDLKNSIP